MPNSRSSPEAVAIQDAYQAQVQALFKVLVTNIGDEPVSHETDQQCLDKFTAGLNIAKRAKQLALSAVAPAPAARAVSARRTRAKKK
jgi:hypothetical protein